MKFILLVTSMLLDGDGGRAASESTAVYGDSASCIKAVEVRTGQTMQSIRGGFRLEANINNLNGRRVGQTIFVCSPFGGE